MVQDAHYRRSRRSTSLQKANGSEIAAVLGLSEVDAALKLLIDEELQVRYAHFGVRRRRENGNGPPGGDDRLRLILQAIDGPLSRKPHPRTFGTFPRVLSRYVREEKVLALENAVFKMTGMPAARMGLWDRGLIRPGMKADITVFDPDTIIDKATFENPSQYPVGIPYVMLNGVMVVEEGDTTGKIAGRVIRRK